MSGLLASLPVPLVGAPMAGGPSCPALVAAHCAAGATAFLAAGYKAPGSVRDEVRAARELVGDAPFGVNVFVPGPGPGRGAAEALSAYAVRLAGEAERRGVELPRPRWDDNDSYAEKVALLVAEPVPAVSFTFGLPAPDVVAALRGVGSEVWAGATSVAEARAAAELGVDAVVVQGCDAGGHRATHDAAVEPNELVALELVGAVLSAGVDVPLVAAGGVGRREDVARLLDAGASAVQVGTALLLADEAGTSTTYRAALRRRDLDVVVTRAFSGRPARGLRNGFVSALDAVAPAVFPQVDQLTKPLRAAAAAAGDTDGVSAWAGAGWRECVAAPAVEILASLAPPGPGR